MTITSSSFNEGLCFFEVVNSVNYFNGIKKRKEKYVGYSKIQIAHVYPMQYRIGINGQKGEVREALSGWDVRVECLASQCLIKANCH